MNVRNLLVVATVVLFSFTLYALAVEAPSYSPDTLRHSDFKINEVCFPSVLTKTCFSIEVADEVSERQQGLMFRKSLGEKEGMLFVFPNEGIYSFWMKNTLIPLDMIWINKTNNESDDIYYVSAIISDVKPCDENVTKNCPVYTPNSSSNYVLELNANSTLTHNIQIGDRVDINLVG